MSHSLAIQVQRKDVGRRKPSENDGKRASDTPLHLRNRDKTPTRTGVCLNRVNVSLQVFVSGGTYAAPAAKKI